MDDFDIPGVVHSEGDHPGGGPYFEVRRKEALEELRQALRTIQEDRGA